MDKPAASLLTNRALPPIALLRAQHERSSPPAGEPPRVSRGHSLSLFSSPSVWPPLSFFPSFILFFCFCQESWPNFCPTMGKIETGAKFFTFQEFESAFEQWKCDNFHPFRVARSETLRMPDGSANEIFKYRYIVYHCAHYGAPRMRGTVACIKSDDEIDRQLSS